MASAKGSSGRRFRATSAAAIGAATKSPFDGFIPIANPTTSPAATASVASGVSVPAGRRREPTSSSTIDW